VRPVRRVAGQRISRSVIWENLTPNEAWAFLSGVAQRLTRPSRVGKRLCGSLRLHKRSFHLHRSSAKYAGEAQRERPGRCSTKLGRLDKTRDRSNGRHVPARAQGSWNTLMRQRHRFADEEWWHSVHGGSVRPSGEQTAITAVGLRM
jgi:hypothetical protein